MKRFSCLAFLALALPVASQPSVTVLRHVRLIDGRGGPVVDDACLVISGERVRQVGRSSDVSIPEGATVIDLHGAAVVPGLVSDHSHVGETDGTINDGAACYNRANILRQLRQWQAYGVTTVTSLGLNDPSVFYPLRRGPHPGSRLLGADRGLGCPGGAPPVNVTRNQLDRPETPAQAADDVDQASNRGADIIKLWLDDFGGTLPRKMSPAVYGVAIKEAHDDHLRVAAHIFDLDDAVSVLDAGVDVLAHGVRDRDVTPAFVRAMKRRNVGYIPTLDLDESFYANAEPNDNPYFLHALQPALKRQFDDPAWRQKVLTDPKLESHKAAVRTNLRNLKTLYDAGVRIGFGTDSGATPLRIPGWAEHRELHLMVEAGLTPLQAVTVATGGAAALMNLGDRGVLAPGKLADFLVLDADPTESIDNMERIRQVWQGGVRVSGRVEDFTP